MLGGVWNVVCEVVSDSIMMLMDWKNDIRFCYGRMN